MLFVVFNRVVANKIIKRYGQPEETPSTKAIDEIIER